jgi:hypothetical protein
LQHVLGATDNRQQEERAFCIAVKTLDESDIATALTAIYPDAVLQPRSPNENGSSPDTPFRFTRPVLTPSCSRELEQNPKRQLTGKKRNRST